MTRSVYSQPPAAPGQTMKGAAAVKNKALSTDVKPNGTANKLTRGVSETKVNSKTSSNSSWHANPSADVESRRVIIQKIVRLLDGCKPKAFTGKMDKLIDLARRLEMALYRSSKSEKEYMDTATLRARVVNLVKNSSNNKNKKPTPAQAQQPKNVVSTPVITDKQRQEVLRQRQQRLLLLRHASQCPSNGENKCLVTPHCAAMKVLWKHIAKCKDHQCVTPHCVSSRFVLSHYHRCVDKKCPVCQPVRVISLKRSQYQQQQKQKQQNNKTGNVRKTNAKLTDKNTTSTPQKSKPALPKQTAGTNTQMKKTGAAPSLASTSVKSALEKQRIAKEQAQQDLKRRRLLNGTSSTPPKTDPNMNKKDVTTPPPNQAVIRARESQIAAYRLNQARMQRLSMLKIDPRRARSCRSGTGPSLPLSLSKTAILSHLKSLKVERLQSSLFPLLRKLMESKHNKGVFNEPVDAVALNIPDYHVIVKEPMDLGTVRQKLEDGVYAKLGDFEKDVRLAFTNAIKFNPPEHPVNIWAGYLIKSYEADIPKVIQKMEKEVKKRNDKCQLCFQNQCEVCPLCERGCIAFEPKVIYCSGPCANRIGRNSNYYATPGSSHIWCNDCYDKSKKDAIEANGQVFKKSDLEKKRNNELFAEPWVSCDTCDKWIHQICALFNARKNNPNEHSKYTCPECLLSKSSQGQKLVKDIPSSTNKLKLKIPSGTSKGSSISKSAPSGSLKNSNSMVKRELPFGKKVPDADDLEHTRLGVFLENWVRNRLGQARDAEKKNPPAIKGDRGPEPSKLHIRVLSNYDELCKVKPFVKKALPSYPDSFSFRSRCIFLFQELDGVDVLIYAMFVQEYGSDCPEPNRRKLYIAYLDSVHYFRPRRLRTLVYHELILAYLEYSRRSGFTSAYIWACPPPNKRDDYILHCHPEDQRVPSADRLRKWYHDMIKRGCKQRIIVGSCSLFDEHFEETVRPATKGKGKKQKKKDKKGKKQTSTTAASSATANSVTKPPPPPPPPKPNSSSNSAVLVVSTPDKDNKKSDANQPNKPGCVNSGNGLKIRENRNTKENLEKRKQKKLALLAKLPYFEGDYWPQEAEELAKEQDAKKKKKNEANNRNRRRKSETASGKPAANTGKPVAKPRESTSVRTSQEAAAAKNRIGERKPSAPSSLKRERDGSPTLKDVKSGQVKKEKDLSTENEVSAEISRQLLIGRLSEQLEAMKDDFLVVKLAHECSRCGEYLLRGRWECRHPDCRSEAVYNSPCPFALCNACYILERARPKELQHASNCLGLSPKSVHEEKKKEEGKDQKVIDNSKETQKRLCDSLGSKSQHDAKRLKNEFGEKMPQTMDEVQKRRMQILEETRRSLLKIKPEQIAAWKNMKPECNRPLFVPEKDHRLYYVDENMPVKTPIYDKIHKNHLVESRHAFLSLCTGNRYQFDQLRRAKHSTMMVLYHLHNPEAPAHLYTCNECQKDILSGNRHHCDLCNGGDFDLCEVCANRVKHVHKLNTFVVTRGVNSASPGSKQMQQRKLENRRARKHSLQLFLQALVHASSCDSSDCGQAPCKKMKELLTHRLNCKIRVRGGCEVCRRVLCLVQMHARNCSLKQCRVPHCDDLKAHIAQQKAQAEANARRRIEQQKQEQSKTKTTGQSVTKPKLIPKQVAKPKGAKPKPKGSSRGRGRGTTRGRGRGRGVTTPTGVGRAKTGTQMKATLVAGSGGTKLKFKTTAAPLAKSTRGGRTGSIKKTTALRGGRGGAKK